MLLPWLSLFDLRTVFTNYLDAHKVLREKCEDFVVMIPIFNDVKYITNIESLKRYKEKVIFCTTNLETEKFYSDLKKIADENKFQIIRCEFKEEAKNPWKIYHKTLLAHDYVLGESIKLLNVKYVIFLDADTACKADLAYLAGNMEQSELDLASVKVIPSKTNTFAEKMQDIEYKIAMKSRKIYPWLTSGAAMIGKRTSLIKIMEKHSLFFNGGDIEIGKIANLSGLNVGHIPMTFYTDVPSKLYDLFKQRFSWFCGAFRHSIVNAHTNLFNPIYSFYFTVIIFLMLPFKIYELIIHWYIIPFLYLFYLVVMVLTNWEFKNRYMLLFPFYSLFQVIVLPICGIIRYIKTVHRTKNIGMMKIHYKQGYHPAKYTRNIFILLLVFFIIFNIHLVEGKLLLSNIDLLQIVGISFYEQGALGIIFNGLKLSMLLIGVFLVLLAIFKTRYHFKKEKTNIMKNIKGFLRKYSIRT